MKSSKSHLAVCVTKSHCSGPPRTAKSICTHKLGLRGALLVIFSDLPDPDWPNRENWAVHKSRLYWGHNFSPICSRSLFLMWLQRLFSSSTWLRLFFSRDAIEVQSGKTKRNINSNNQKEQKKKPVYTSPIENFRIEFHKARLERRCGLVKSFKWHLAVCVKKIVFTFAVCLS